MWLTDWEAAVLGRQRQGQSASPAGSATDFQRQSGGGSISDDFVDCGECGLALIGMMVG